MQQPSLPVNDSLVHTFETVIARYNSVLEEVDTLNAYIEAFVTTNTHDTLAQAKLSQLEQSGVILYNGERASPPGLARGMLRI